ncbi:MAG TPA: zinc ribbon domain-containing protein [Bacteroidales bacterium]|nr:zinc ribbon domain-containing protein [Bacteroidales bacterium]HNS45798.1 zinc ribbon domain-containing protein [Bacteroidales bacterium]
MDFDEFEKDEPVSGGKKGRKGRQDFDDMDDLGDFDEGLPSKTRRRTSSDPEIFCPSCGADIPPFAKRCPECGERLDFGSFCHYCGAEVSPGARFCSNCGAKVS